MHKVYIVMNCKYYFTENNAALPDCLNPMTFEVLVAISLTKCRETCLAPQEMRGPLWDLMRTSSKSPSALKPFWPHRRRVVPCRA